ncbi:MAG TPA: DUF72 domain-containing protein [Ignavibacteriaceae bacterium]|nr:DUF72 domain-containing protein [Ignavibacteriaceae bacterium]
MNLFVGTSGYSYKEWKGNFYPEDLPDKKMLGYYSERFSTVEINNTFYRMPKREVFESWKEQVPANFKFILKAPRQITHSKPLKEKDSAVEYFLKTSSALNEKLGVYLFQLPPYARKDIETFRKFTEIISGSARAAFEFRHLSWFDDEVYDSLKKGNFALCLSDTDEEPIKQVTSTADWGYLRLRRTGYDKKSLTEWHKKITGQNWKEAYIFFKHEEEGKGPEFAKKFIELI